MKYVLEELSPEEDLKARIKFANLIREQLGYKPMSNLVNLKTKFAPLLIAFGAGCYFGYLHGHNVGYSTGVDQLIPVIEKCLDIKIVHRTK